MSRIIRQIRPDIVHTHTHVGASWGRAAAILARVQLIAHTEHTSVTKLTLLDWAIRPILKRRTHAVVTFSERSANLVRRRDGLCDLSIIPNGIRILPPPTVEDRRNAHQKLGLDEKLLVVGMIANLHPHKNPALLIEAVARLPNQTRECIQLAFFGDGPLRQDLAVRATELGVYDLVRFYGFRSDLQDLLAGLDLVVSTSSREMMPISLLEAMNAALPIIGVPHAGILDLVVDGETGIVLKSWDAQALADAIDWALKHPEWRTRAGNAAYARVSEKFDIEIVADRYAEMYFRLLKTEPVRI